MLRWPASFSPNWTGWFLVVLANVCFSVVSPIGRYVVSNGMDPALFVVLRWSMAALLLSGTVAVVEPQRLFMDQNGLRFACLAGLFNSFSALTFASSLKYLDASMASMIYSALPLAVLVLLRFRGEKFTYRNLVRIAIAVLGVYLLIGPGGDVPLIGVLLVLAAVVFFAVQLVLVQWYLRAYNPRTVALYIMIMIALVNGSWWWFQGSAWHMPSQQVWLAIGLLALVGSYLSRICYYGGIQRIGSGQASMLSPLETLLTVVWATLFLQERLSPVQWIGGALILLSALLAIQRLGRARWRPRLRMGARM